MRPQWPSRKTAFLLCMRNTRRWKALDALKITHQYTSNSLIESANAVSQQSWTSIQASKKTLAERYAVIVATVGVTFFLAVFLALFIYRSIVRNVVDPIKRLNNCMLDRVNRIPTPFPESVRYELAEMTSSVRYFTSEIEKHEQELLHSHENLEKQVAERTCELKALSEKLLMAQESERFKLASELHDNIGATLGAIKFGMERSLRSIRSLPEHDIRRKNIVFSKQIDCRFGSLSVSNGNNHI